jgi:hypothetical protein
MRRARSFVERSVGWKSFGFCYDVMSAIKSDGSGGGDSDASDIDMDAAAIRAFISKTLPKLQLMKKERITERDSECHT